MLKPGRCVDTTVRTRQNRVRIARHDALGALLLACGIALLLDNFDLVEGASKAWPAAVLLSGAALLVAGWNQAKLGRGMVGVGIFLSLCAVLFFYLNARGWERLENLWPLFMGFLGVAIIAGGRTGIHKVLLSFAILLIILCVTFIVVFNVDPRLWPLALSVAGLTLFFVGRY